MIQNGNLSNFLIQEPYQLEENGVLLGGASVSLVWEFKINQELTHSVPKTNILHDTQ